MFGNLSHLGAFLAALSSRVRRALQRPVLQA
jgi:hypothetical protein